MQTPYFVIRKDLLADNIASFQQALKKLWPNGRIAYSIKTNCLPHILSTLHSWGVWAEAVSDEEYTLARLCGFSDREIVFNGPIKSVGRLESAVRQGAVVNFDSRRELEWLRETGPALNGNIGFRVNVDVSIYDPADVGFQEDGFRFGYSAEIGDFSAAAELYEALYGSRDFGLHLHVNTITRSVDAYRKTAGYAADLIKEYRLTPAFIDIGGGFFGGVPGKPTAEEYISAIREVLEPVVNPEKTTLILEPGSAVIGSAVELHTTVLDVKDTKHGRIVTTDGSRIHIDPLWLKKGYLYDLTDAEGNAVTERKTRPRQVICGYTCMDHDRLMVLKDQPEIMVSDRIVYRRVGNYTMTFGGPFIRPFPDVYEENGGAYTLVRRSMTVEDFYRMESV